MNYCSNFLNHSENQKGHIEILLPQGLHLVERLTRHYFEQFQRNDPIKTKK